MRIPGSLFYSVEHLWAKSAGDGIWEAGITDYAQDLLGDVVFIEPPKLASLLFKSQPCGLVESVKTGSDLHALVDGEVVEVNDELLNTPELINDKPYDAWIFKFKSSEDLQQKLLNAEAYKALISKL